MEKLLIVNVPFIFVAPVSVVPTLFATIDPGTVTDVNDAAPDGLIIHLVEPVPELPSHTPMLAPLLIDIYMLGVAFK